MVDQNTFVYEVLTEFNRAFYSDLLTASHQFGERKPINLGTKDDPDVHTFYLYKKDMKIYALEEQHVKDLPILITGTKRKIHYRDVFDIIVSYQSARFKAVKGMEFRQLVNDLCPFEHEAPRDYTLWKIMGMTALIGRTAFRVCSPPAFGKDSVMKVLGFLTSDVCVIANPTVPKLEYRLQGNKVLMLNEFANLKSDDKSGMEHLLQSVGDLSPVYEKRSRAGSGTVESIPIGDVSIMCAYNDLDCYVDEDKYFDMVFSKQSKDRFIPVKFRGKIAQQIKHVADPVKIATENEEYLKGFIRTIMYYRKHWRTELEGKRSWPVKVAADYGFDSRWANNFDRIREFVLLYSETAEEANVLLNTLYNRHVEYLEQFSNGNGSLLRDYKQKQSEELLVVAEEHI
jgi:hypothetical protein